MAKTPTTQSTAEDFKQFLREMSYGIHEIVEGHTKAHTEANREARADRYNYAARNIGAPDSEAMSMAYSVCIDMLWGMVIEITEAEQRLEYVEAEPDSEEYQHALGEVFGAKSVFLSVHTRMVNLEHSRIEATRQGRNQRAFLGDVVRAEGDTIRVSYDRPHYSYGVERAELFMPTVVRDGIKNPNYVATKDFKDFLI